METKKEPIIKNKQPDTIKKNKLLRKEEPTPEDILEGISMQSPTLLKLISDNNSIQYYTKLGRGVYSCRYNGHRIVLTLNNYNADSATCESLLISKKDYSTNMLKETSVYMKDGELRIEKR